MGNQYPTTTKHPTDLVPHTMQEGRLRKDLTDSETGTIQTVFLALKEAHVVMGLNFEPSDLLMKAKSIIDFVLTDYRLAWTEDLLKAIQWGSFGKLESKNELTTISARNVYQWYQLLRKNFPAELSHPMLSSNPATVNQMPEPSEDEKKQLAKDFFKSAITDPDSIIGGIDHIFAKIVSMGFFSPKYEQMEQRFRVELNKAAFSFKVDNQKDQKIKGQLLQIQNIVNGAEPGTKINFEKLKAMESLQDAFILISETVKKEIIKEIMKINSVEFVMNLYQ